MLQPKPFRVLLIEDNRGDAELTREAFQGSNFPYRLLVASDGPEALRYLRPEQPMAARDRPDLILLDWNLPGMGGGEFLREIKQDEQLREIPVVVLTSSQSHIDVNDAYDLHANCFIVKPASLLQFFNVIGALEQFWLQTATLPST